jgi:hypothetical protein
VAFQQSLIFSMSRKGGRVVEGTGLENRRARKGTVGSNPTPSAINDGFSMAYRKKSRLSLTVPTPPREASQTIHAGGVEAVA